MVPPLWTWRSIERKLPLKDELFPTDFTIGDAVVRRGSLCILVFHLTGQMNKCNFLLRPFSLKT